MFLIARGLNKLFQWLQRDSNLQPLSSQTNTQPFSQARSVWLKGSVFVCELTGYGFEFRCNHLNFSCPPVSSKDFLDIQAIIVWIHSETCTRQDKNIQPNYFSVWEVIILNVTLVKQVICEGSIHFDFYSINILIFFITGGLDKQV